jgi:integrase
VGSYWDPERKHWRYQFKRNGIRYTGRGYKTKRDSEEAEADRRKELRLAPQPIPETPTAFSAYVKQYLQYAERKFVKDVAKRKYSTFKKFIESQGDLPIEQIAPIHIHNYLNTLPTNNSYNEHRQELSSLFAWIKKMDPYKFQFMVNPCLALDPMAVDEPEPPTPTVDEVLKIIAAATPGDEQDLVLCCLHLLGRIDEILRLRWKDVNFEKRTVTLWTRKRRDGKYESDQMPMNQVLYDTLKNRWQKRTQDQWVYFNKKAQEGKGDRYYHRPRMMASICKRAGITPVGKGEITLWRGKDKGKVVEIDHHYGFHSFRHFMASYLADVEKISSKSAQRLLRHKNLSTTEGYLHFIDPNQRATMASVEGKFAKLHPSGTPTKEKGAASSDVTP